MKREQDIILSSRERGKPQIIISVQNDCINGIRKDQRQNFPLKIGWNMKNPRVIHDLENWLKENNYTKNEQPVSISISPMEHAMGKIPQGWRGKIKY